MQPQGLSSEEVKKRKVSGRSNDTDDQSSRSYLDILIKNLATPFNLILFILGALLIVMPEKPDYINSMAATGVILSCICPLMYMNNPLCGPMPVITCSNKLRTYTTARYYTEDEILTQITKGGARA